MRRPIGAQQLKTIFSFRRCFCPSRPANRIRLCPVRSLNSVAAEAAAAGAAAVAEVNTVAGAGLRQMMAAVTEPQATTRAIFRVVEEEIGGGARRR
jgi:hypothetical protein